MANIILSNRGWYFLISCNEAPREIKVKYGKSCNTFATSQHNSLGVGWWVQVDGMAANNTNDTVALGGNGKTLSRIQDL